MPFMVEIVALIFIARIRTEEMIRIVSLVAVSISMYQSCMIILQGNTFATHVTAS